MSLQGLKSSGKKKKNIKEMKSWDDFKTTEEIQVPERLIDQVVGQDRAVKIIKKAATQKRNVMLIGEPGTGKCVGPDTPITLAHGRIIEAKKLFEIAKENGEVWVNDSQKTIISGVNLSTVAIDPQDLKVKHKEITYAARFNAPKILFKVETRSGSRMTLTKDHPVLTITKDSEIKWLPVKNLKKGDKIGCVRSIPFLEEDEIDLEGIKISKNKFQHKSSFHDHSSKPIKVPRRVDQRLARFLAYFISETSITRNRNVIFVNNEKEFVEDFIQLTRDLFEVNFTVGRRGESWYAQASSSSLCYFMHRIFGVPLTIKGRSREIPFPSQLLSARIPVLAEFLKTLFEMEGSVQEKRRKCVEICSASKKLTHGIQIALLRYGIISKLKRRLSAATNTRNPQMKVYYYLYIQGTKNLTLFADNINFKSRNKRGKLQESIKNTSPNPNLDVIPNVGNDLQFLKTKLHFKNTEVTRYPVTFSSYKSIKRSPSSMHLAKLMENISRIYLEKHAKTGFYEEEIEDAILKLFYLCNSDIYWDSIVKTEKISHHPFIYDFTVEGHHNFLAGNVLLHNSMLANAMAELMPTENLTDVLAYPNQEDENNPRVRITKAGEGLQIMRGEKKKENISKGGKKPNPIFFIVLFFLLPLIAYFYLALSGIEVDSMPFLLVMGLGFFFLLFTSLNLRGMMMPGFDSNVPRLIVDNSKRKMAPFFDGTGAHAGALLGDIKHDPLQCIPGDELVHLPNGKPIEIGKLVDPLLENESKCLQAKEEFEVLAGFDNSYCYTSTKVKRVFKRRYKGELIELTTRRGYRIRATPNHPLALLDSSGNIEYRRTDNISKGMPLVVPDKLPLEVGDKLNDNFITLLAYILADGCISEGFVSFKLRREFKIKEILRCIRENDLMPRVREYRDKDSGKQTTVININSREFVRKLLVIGAKEDNKKRIPLDIYNQSLDKIKLFLAKYISLDGYVNKQGQFELFSKELIPEFLPLLLKVGIKASLKHRKDPGFGKGKLQKVIYFSDYYFTREYFKITSNPVHKKNLRIYLKKTKSGHVTFNDVIPLNFNVLERIRLKTGLSQNRIHKAYYALKDDLKTSQALTRGFLRKIVSNFLNYTNCPELYKLKNIGEGTYAYDTVTSIKRIEYSGFVYNLTTETGNYLVNNILTHNSGGLGTPPHLRVVAGMIHKAHKGVLFIDEIGTLGKSQQDLLSAMQDKKLSITGRSEMSSGAMVMTDPVPCDFVLVASGNIHVIEGMHPALRSRIRGYGYEIYMDNVVPDINENRKKVVQFIAQEVEKDKKIPHFTKEAVEDIIREFKRKAGMKGKLSLRFRELGGLIRAAGDISTERNHKFVTLDDVTVGKKSARTLEHQMGDIYIERRKEYEVLITKGSRVGRVNGLAVLGEGGIVLPIEAEVAPGGKKAEIIATGKLGEIAKEAVKNVSAVIMKAYGEDIKEKYDLFVQFLQTYEGVEGDSASISVAVAVISALKNAKVDQEVGMTGSLTVRGEVLPVGGVTQKIEAAIESGLKKVIIPKSNEDDVLLEKRYEGKIKILTARNITDVLKHSLTNGKEIAKQMEKVLNR